MGMIGNQIAAGQALTIANDSFNGDGSTVAFTLSQTVSSVNDIEVLVDNVQQSPYDSSYSVSGTTLTFSGAPSAGTNNVYVIYNASKHITTQQVIPDDGSVTHSKFHTTALNPITLDQTNNRVGIGTSSPNEALTIEAPLSGHTGLAINYSGDNKAGITVNPITGQISVGVHPDLTSASAYYLSFNTAAANTVYERMKIDSAGRVTMPNQPSFMVYGGFSYQASTYIWQGFGTVDHNIGGHWNNSIGRFTAPVAGKYMIYATAHHSTVSTYHLWAFLKNGSLGGGNWVQSYDTSGGAATTSKQQVWNLAAGDYLEVASNATYANAYLGGYVTVGAYLVG